MLRDDTPSALLFFIQQSGGIGNASPLLKDAGSRNTRRRCRTPPAWKLSIRLNYPGSMNEVKKKGGGKKKDRRKRERKKVVAYTPPPHTHTHTYTHCGMSCARCVISEMANENGGEEITIAKRYRVPPRFAPPKIFTLWISAWLARKTRWYELSRW